MCVRCRRVVSYVEDTDSNEIIRQKNNGSGGGDDHNDNNMNDNIQQTCRARGEYTWAASRRDCRRLVDLEVGEIGTM